MAFGLSCLHECGILVPRQKIVPSSPALKGRVVTTGTPGQSLDLSLMWTELIRPCGLWALGAPGFGGQIWAGYSLTYGPCPHESPFPPLCLPGLWEGRTLKEPLPHIPSAWEDFSPHPRVSVRTRTSGRHWPGTPKNSNQNEYFIVIF